MQNQNHNQRDAGPDHYTLVDKTGRELRLEKTYDSNGVVFYEAPLEWRVDARVPTDK